MSSFPPQSPVVSAGASVGDQAPSKPCPSWLLVVIVFLGFALFGVWRAPVPGVNEPHYLSKARHFWDPAWCARDLFLQSANPHCAFYATFGVVTRVLSFEQTAWLGRGLVWSLLAVGWVAFSRLVVPGRWGPVWSAALFLAISATGNLSGEWLIGGVEAKGFAYAALFLGIAAAMRGHFLAAATGCGIATSFHPIVGIWGAAALAFALGWARFSAPERSPGAADDESVDTVPNEAARSVPSFAAQLARPALAFIACSLPGLIPAVAMLVDGMPREMRHTADELQVFYRLDHHLDPTQFSPFSWGMYAVLLTAWLATRAWKESDPARRLFAGFVVAALLIAAAGAVVGFGPRWASVLKFYPFRLADLFLPIAVALSGARWLEWIALRFRHSAASRGFVTDAGHMVSLAALVWALDAPGDDRNPTGWTEIQRADWLDVCRWVADHTPADALCLTPRYRNYTFKWHGSRAEYATWKDCPQDPQSLIEWKERLDRIHDWRTKHFPTGFTQEALDELRQSTRIDYSVDWYVHAYRVEPIYKNRSFRVYALVPAQGESESP